MIPTLLHPALHAKKYSDLLLNIYIAALTKLLPRPYFLDHIYGGDTGDIGVYTGVISEIVSIFICPSTSPSNRLGNDWKESTTVGISFRLLSTALNIICN